MPKVQYNNIIFTAISAAIPEHTIDNIKYTDFEADVVSEIVEKQVLSRGVLLQSILLHI